MRSYPAAFSMSTDEPPWVSIVYPVPWNASPASSMKTVAPRDSRSSLSAATLVNPRFSS